LIVARWKQAYFLDHRSQAPGDIGTSTESK
jgi:hypothetical protein